MANSSGCEKHKRARPGRDPPEDEWILAMGVVYVKNTPHWPWKAVIDLSTVCLGYPFTPTLTLPLKGEGIWRKHRLQGYGYSTCMTLLSRSTSKYGLGLSGFWHQRCVKKAQRIGQLHRWRVPGIQVVDVFVQPPWRPRPSSEWKNSVIMRCSMFVPSWATIMAYWVTGKAPDIIWS